MLFSGCLASVVLWPTHRVGHQFHRRAADHVGGQQMLSDSPRVMRPAKFVFIHVRLWLNPEEKVCLFCAEEVLLCEHGEEHRLF
jgi:hypothetical protein